MYVYIFACACKASWSSATNLNTLPTESLPSFEISMKCTTGVITPGCSKSLFHLAHSHARQT